MKILIKCTRMKIEQSVDIPDDGSITTVGDLKAHLAKSFSFGANPRIIFAGHILKDNQTLSEVCLKEGSALYIVPSVAPAPATTTTTTPSTTTSSSGAAAAAAAAPPSSQQPLFPTPGASRNGMGIDPEMVSQLANNPIAQQMLSNPELLKATILSDPRMKRIYETNQEVRTVLDDPATLQQIADTIRDPELMARMQQNADRVMSSLENIPEAHRVMQRLFASMDEAETNAELSSIQQKPVVVPEAPTGPNPTEAPLPNPWGNPQAQQQQQQQNSGMPFNAGQNGGFNFGNFFAQQNGNAGPDVAAMLDNPMVQSMMQEFAKNPQMMMSMMEADPNTKAMMDSNPMIRSLLSNPEYLKQMFTPENMRMASQALNSMGPGAFPQQPMAYGQGSQQGGNDMASLEERYRVQLGVLEDMGFLDKEKNLRALSATNGSVQLAIEKLLAGF